MYSNISNVLMGGFDGLIDDLAGHLAKDLNVDLKDIKKSLATFGGGKKSSYALKDNGIKGIVIVKDYSPKSHALFGETKKYKDSIIEDINKVANKKLLCYERYLAFGPGWVLTDKSKLDIVKSAFEKAKVDVQVIPLSKFEKDHPPKKLLEEKKVLQEEVSQDSDLKAKSHAIPMIRKNLLKMTILKNHRKMTIPMTILKNQKSHRKMTIPMTILKNQKNHRKMTILKNQKNHRKMTIPMTILKNHRKMTILKNQKNHQNQKRMPQTQMTKILKSLKKIRKIKLLLRRMNGIIVLIRKDMFIWTYL